MPRPKTKSELINLSEKGYQELVSLVEGISEQDRLTSGVCGKWSVKDILAHLHAWHMLCLTWHQEGQGNIKPPMPAPDFNWKQTPELNEVIYQEYKDEEFGKVQTSLAESHQEIMSIINKYSDQELFTKKLYKWTGSTSMGSYFTSAASSHYDWAVNEITRWLQANPDLA